jgi:hypothetical protein
VSRLLRVIVYSGLAIASVYAFVFAGRLSSRSVLNIGYIRPLEPKYSAYIGNMNSKKFAFPWCYGAEILKPVNRVGFSSITEAEGRGYVKSKVCSGL